MLHVAWLKPRKHLVTKGIGVYALLDVAADLWLERRECSQADRRFFIQKLTDFAAEIDWGSAGDFAGLGGEGGAKAAAAHIRAVRRRLTMKAVANG